ncbi:ADP-ribosyltransferase [Micromonospora sp. NPDC049497]|uniref:ADP-ribosyltransferase n=1 Tax=Micromonospora sp. NPDC049497 TaxID=3364273 RepID=UPI0037B77499
MGLELPAELTEPLSWIGLEWPQADEELLFAAGQRWLEFGLHLQQAADRAEAAAQAIWQANVGATVDAFQQWWQRDDGPRLRLREDAIAAQLIGAALIAFAALTLAMKIAFFVQLVVLLVQVSMAIAAAVPTAGASTAAVPGFIAATRIVCQRLVRMLVDQVRTLLKEILERAKSLLKIVRRRPGTARPPRTPGPDPTPVGAPPGRALTDADRVALTDYTGPGYRAMNPFLRDPGRYTPDEAAALQVRADRVSEALAKLPERPGTTYRGGQYPDDLLARYEPGQVVTERAFTSTSTDPRVAQGAFDGNTVMVISGRNGRDVAPYSEYPDEAEILYDQATNFKVTSKAWDADLGKWVVTMEEM